MKPLSVRQIDILSGRAGLSQQKIDAYRVVWLEQGYDIPEALGGVSALSRLGRLAGAVVQHAGAGFPKASQEMIEQRLAICGGCSWYGNEHCGVCKCHMPTKVRMADASCPLDDPLWTPYVAPESPPPPPNL